MKKENKKIYYYLDLGSPITTLHTSDKPIIKKYYKEITKEEANKIINKYMNGLINFD